MARVGTERDPWIYRPVRRARAWQPAMAHARQRMVEPRLRGRTSTNSTSYARRVFRHGRSRLHVRRDLRECL